MKKISFKTNRALFIGVFMSAFYFAADSLGLALPELIKGFVLGIAMVGYGLGLYGMKHDISKFCEWKKALLQRS